MTVTTIFQEWNCASAGSSDWDGRSAVDHSAISIWVSAYVLVAVWLKGRRRGIVPGNRGDNKEWRVYC